MSSSNHGRGTGTEHGVQQDALPSPDATALEHSERLVSQLDARLADGPLSFAEYMHCALYTPGLGYYMAGARKFGIRGDFVTAPEVSPLFGATLATQCQEIFDVCDAQILELGAGSGRLAASLLDALQSVPELQYYILEPSAELRYRQRELLATTISADRLRRVHWIDTLPAQFNGMVLANEVMDALPVERFVVADVLQQMGVVRAATEADLGYQFTAGYCSEISLLLSPWIQSLADCLARGVILLADYGYPRREYYLPERTSGTLTCYYQHHAHDDPYRYPGLQDITAHVDFTRVAETAIDAQLALLGYTSQASFLLALDLMSHADKALSHAAGDVDRLAITQAIKTLTLPGEMGERFQVMALGKGYDRPLRGFSHQDLSHRL